MKEKYPEVHILATVVWQWKLSCVLSSGPGFVCVDCEQDLVMMSLDKKDSSPCCSSGPVFSSVFGHSHLSPLSPAQTVSSFRSGIVVFSLSTNALHSE